MKKIYIIAFALLMVSVLLEVIYLTNHSQLASESVKAEELRLEIAKLDEDNQVLKNEVLSRSSLVVVASKAAEMGFDRPDKFISIKDFDPIALNHE